MAFIASGATSYIGPFGPIIINTELDMASSVSSEGNVPLELLLDGLLMHACITPVVVSPVAFANLNCIYEIYNNDDNNNKKKKINNIKYNSS